MSGHTPGPWKLVPGGDTAIYDSRGEPVIGRGSFHRRGHPEAWANLGIAAAAPELLEALIECLTCEFAATEKAAVAKAEAAIAKATGAAP